MKGSKTEVGTRKLGGGVDGNQVSLSLFEETGGV